MDENPIVYSHVFTWDQFQRVLPYSKKYYGMDEPYLYRMVGADLAGRGQSITIRNRLVFDDFWKQVLSAGKAAAKYMEQMCNQQNQM